MDSRIVANADNFRPPNNLPYLVAVVSMVLLGVATVVALSIARPTESVTTLTGLVFGFIAPTTLSLLAFMKSQETHLIVNSRMDEFKRDLVQSSVLATEAARAVGVKEGLALGVAQANIRTDALADQDKQR